MRNKLEKYCADEFLKNCRMNYLQDTKNIWGAGRKIIKGLILIFKFSWTWCLFFSVITIAYVHCVEKFCCYLGI